MTGLWWTPVLLTFLLHPPGSFAEVLSVVVRDADQAVLDCPGLSGTRQDCRDAVWTLGESTEPLQASDRLSVTPRCSLLFKEVMVEDAGLYRCRTRDHNHTQVALSVLSIVECKSHRFVTLECQVSGAPPHAVRWEGAECEEDIVTSQSERFASASFGTAHPVHASRAYESWRCHLTDNITAEEHQFTYSPQYPGKPTAPPAATTAEGPSSVDWAVVVLHLLEILLLSVVTVRLCRSSGRRRAAGGEHTALTPVRAAADSQLANRVAQEVPPNYENV